VLRFRDHAFNVYFAHEPYLRMIREKFGPETADHIRDMTSHRIERLYTTA
jgi:anaerobic magnesium-protoporphyrin IX monomethyl ester cyclase